MSTKMSVDMVTNRSTTRVHAPPGGATTISFGDEFTPLSTAPPSPARKGVDELDQKVSALSLDVAAAQVAPPAPAPAATAAPAPTPVAGSVTVLVSEGKCDAEVLNAIVRALAMEGISNPTAIKVADPSLLPYTAQKLGGIVICAACVNGSSSSGAKSSSLEGALLQTGVSSGVYIVPAIIEASSLLEARVLLADKSSAWAQSAKSLLHLQSNVLPTPISYAKAVLPPPPPVLAADSLDVKSLLEDLRLSLKQHGANGIFGLGRKFKIADDNNSGTLDASEFTKMINEHAMHWTPAQIKAVFDAFDIDASGTITFTEFLKGVRGMLNERRRDLVLRAFELLDKDKNGVLEVSDLVGVYDASKHPDVLSHKSSPQEVLRQFLDTFDSATSKDGKVTTAEFCDYYGTLSASIDEDDYFELMMRNAWHISGGEGWCANSSCKRVLVTHADGHQTVEEIKNDLGVGATDAVEMLKRLVAQGLSDIVCIETAGGIKALAGAATAEGVAAVVAAAAAAAAGEPYRPAAGSAARIDVSSFDTVRPSTAPAATGGAAPAAPRGAARGRGGGESSIVFG